MKYYLILTVLLLGSCEPSSNSSSQNNGEFSLYGPVYEGFIGYPVYSTLDTMASCQFTYVADGQKFRASLKLGELRDRWKGKISIPSGNFEGNHRTFRDSVINGMDSQGNPKWRYYENFLGAAWQQGLADTFHVAIGDYYTSNPYPKTVNAGIYFAAIDTFAVISAAKK